MKFSTRSTYGLRAMINLAKNAKEDSVSLSSIAKVEDISLGYLERLFSKLKKADLIVSEKGSAGGYRLSRNSAKIRVFDIIEALEGEMPPFYCLDKDGKVYCSTKCHCGVTAVLIKVQTAVNTALKNIKLSDLK